MILIATQCFAPQTGGIENLMTGLAAALQQRGHEVTVYADHGRQPLHDDALPASVRRFGGPRPWRRRRKAGAIHRLVADGHINAIICDSWKSLELLRLPAGLPVLCLAHGMELPLATGDRRGPRVAAAFSRASQVIANSDYTAGRVRPWLSSGQSLQVIPPGVAPPAAPGAGERQRVEAVLQNRQPCLISVGRLQAHKGQDTVLACMPELLREFPDLIYVLVGEGPGRAGLERQIRQQGLERHVCLWGTAAPPMRTALLEAADLFVLPGRAVGPQVEGFGIAFLEAAWLGLPAVAGNAGGSAAAVRHGETGLVCDGADQGAVLQALRALLANPAYRQELGAQARQHARRFNWDEIVQRYEALL